MREVEHDMAAHLGRTTTPLGRQRVLKPLLACDVLVLDERGYLPTTPSFGPALNELIAGRYERRPTILTSNKSLTERASIVQKGFVSDITRFAKAPVRHWP